MRKSNSDWLFQRYNTKYNRLWSQITSCGLLIVQLIAGYVFALMAIPSISSSVFVRSFGFLVSLVILLSIISARLDLERFRTKRRLNFLLAAKP